jgi:hypothetical protein
MVMRRKHNRVRVGISQRYVAPLRLAISAAITLVVVASAGAVRTSSPRV